MTVSTLPRRFWLMAAAASLFLVVFLVNLPEASKAPANTNPTMRVQVDPETGTLVPVTGLEKAELDRQMKQYLSRDTKDLPQTHHADGGVSVDLQGRFQSLSVATTDSLGNVRTGCVTSADELDNFLQHDRETE